MVKNGKPQHVILLDPNGEVYETSCFGEVTKLCELLNTNTDSGWRYEIITIGSK